MKMFAFWSLKFVAMGLIGNKLTLVPVMAWQWTYTKQIPEKIIDKIYDAICHHKATISLSTVKSLI